MRFSSSCACLTAVIAVCLGARSGAQAVASINWQHREAKFAYVGYTTLYVCDALEDQVRRVLVYLGARPDAKVMVTCPRGPTVPTQDALVTTDFYVPVPVDPAEGNATGNATGNPTAQWTALKIDARRPGFMGRGDCELMQGMKDLVTKNFGLRDLDYRTNCVPHDLGLDDFSVTATALKVAMPH
jgi:hypothetical protein